MESMEAALLADHRELTVGLVALGVGDEVDVEAARDRVAIAVVDVPSSELASIRGFGADPVSGDRKDFDGAAGRDRVKDDPLRSRVAIAAPGIRIDPDAC